MRKKFIKIIGIVTLITCAAPHVTVFAESNLINSEINQIQSVDTNLILKNAVEDSLLDIRSSENNLIVNAPKYNYYSESTNIKNDICGDTIELVENGVKTIITVDVKHGKVIVNGRQYTIDEYSNAVLEQNKYIYTNNIRKSNELAIVNFLENKGEIEKKCDNSNEIALYCSGCGANPNSAPTTNYKPLATAGNGNTKIEVAVTNAAINLACIKLAPVVAGGVAVKLAFSEGKQIIERFIKEFGKEVAGKIKTTYFLRKQGYHNTCPRAVKETRKYYVDGNYKVFTGVEKPFYFYYIKPYSI